jgi:prevent-host-death family protein
MILYMTTLPLADARARLSEIVSDAETTHERFEITRNGRPAAVLLGADDYEAMRETIAVLSDSELVASVREGLAELREGAGMTEHELADYLRHSGHLGG